MDSPAFFVQAEHIAERTRQETRQERGKNAARAQEEFGNNITRRKGRKE